MDVCASQPSRQSMMQPDKKAVQDAGEIYSQVPYLCIEKYDNSKSWITYPERQSVSLDHIRSFVLLNYDPAHIASVLQGWLFFGLLLSILPVELEIKEEDFILPDEGLTKVVTLSKLPSLLQRWSTIESENSKDRRHSRYMANNDILREAHPIIYHLSTLHAAGGVYSGLTPPLPRNASLLCAELGRTLHIANKAILGYDIDSDQKFETWNNGSMFSEHMEMQGWCPFIVSGIEQSSTLLLMKYLATIGPPATPKDHRRCSDNECRARPLGTHHITDACLCSPATISIDRLRVFILNNETPVIRLLRDSNGIRIEIQAAQESTAYVAISHVWSDGLGDPKSNSMPLCQLEKLQALVDNLYEEPTNNTKAGQNWVSRCCFRQIPSLTSSLWGKPDQTNRDDVNVAIGSWFWIDSLCVPTGKRYPELNKLALPRMKSIYYQAEKVLVLDSEVTACGDATDAQYILAKICLSMWIRRVWTFQEACFARRAFFLVGNSLVSISKLLKAALNSDLPTPLNHLETSRWDGITVQLRQLFRRACMESVEEFQKPVPKITEAAVIAVLREIGSRVSTYRADEAGCLGFLLGVNTETIYEIIIDDKMSKAEEQLHADKRMTELFNLLHAKGVDLIPQGCIPPGIILLPGPRIGINGYRWAPRSFMLTTSSAPGQSLISHDFTIPSSNPDAEPLSRPSGVLSDWGLKIQFPGLILGEVRTDGPMNKYFVIDTSQHKINANEAPLQIWRALYSKQYGDSSWEDMAPSVASENMAIIIFSYGPSWSETMEGILVRIQSASETGDLYVNRVCKMLITGTLENDEYAYMKAPWNRVTGNWCPLDQIWHVD